MYAVWYDDVAPTFTGDYSGNYEWKDGPAQIISVTDASDEGVGGLEYSFFKDGVWTDWSSNNSTTYTVYFGELETAQVRVRDANGNMSAIRQIYVRIRMAESSEETGGIAVTFDVTVPVGSGVVPANASPASAEGSKLLNGSVYVLRTGSGSHEIARFTTNSTSIPRVSSSIPNRVAVSISNSSPYVVTVNPIGTTGASESAVITIHTDRNETYDEGNFLLNVYSSSGPTVTVSYSPSGTTMTNDIVTATLGVVDPYTAIDTNHTITSVTIGGEPVEGTNGNYEVEFDANALKRYVVTDSLGSTVNGDIKVTWIDKVAPTLSLSGIQVNGDGKIQMYAQALDDITERSELEYCWDYSDPEDADWISNARVNMKAFEPDTTVTMAVRDKAGNVTSATETAEYTGSSGDSGGSGGTGGSGSSGGSGSGVVVAGAQAKILKSLRGNINGYILGPTKYMTNANATPIEYSGDDFLITMRIEPVLEESYVEGYIDINGQKYRVSWYTDEEFNTPSSYTSSDTRGVSLAKGTSYGKITLSSATLLTRTARNVSAVLYLTTYSETSCEVPISVEKLTMTYSVDLTPPVVSTSYSNYSRTLDVNTRDAISGVKDNEVSISLNGGERATIPAISSLSPYPDASSTSRFKVTVTAEDKLGNSTEYEHWYQPASGNSGAYSSSDTSAADINVNYSRSRIFNKYFVNGTQSNIAIESIPQN